MSRAKQELARMKAILAGENVDPVPHELAGTGRFPTLAEQLRSYVRGQVSRLAEQHGLGTFDEEDDFSDEAEEPELVSRHELRFMKPDSRESIDGAAAPSPQAVKADGDQAGQNPVP